jgi:hypothetical protein
MAQLIVGAPLPAHAGSASLLSPSVSDTRPSNCASVFKTTGDAGRWPRFPAVFLRWRPDRVNDDCGLSGWACTAAGAAGVAACYCVAATLQAYLSRCLTTGVVCQSPGANPRGDPHCRNPRRTAVFTLAGLVRLFVFTGQGRGQEPDTLLCFRCPVNRQLELLPQVLVGRAKPGQFLIGCANRCLSLLKHSALAPVHG